ncbi:lysylphosphatidylglycerol synthase domain-containing protein [Nocardioides caricicola]|uniref:Lysylphosphatidylglycerol synthase domain-containing protein n=1 Tax=Nocardioides caricicola TaxID=634770 RepID=A0ABW0MYI4_9ACTN
MADHRFFVNDTGSSRRPVDLTTAVVGLLVVLVSTVAAADGDGPLDTAVRRVAAHVPDWVTNLFDAAYALGALYAGVAVVLALASSRHRKRLPVTLVVAAATGVVGVLVTSFLVGAGWPDLAPGPVRSASPDSFPTVRVAATTAVLFALRPWLVLAYRRLTALIVAVQCIAAWIIGTGGPTDVIGALGIGMAAAGIALVLIGSPAGHPDLAQVRRSLADLDVPVDGLRFDERQTWGTRVLHGTSAASGGRVVVKVYGRDATDAHRAERWWRSLVYRDQSAPDSTRLQLVEHEALVTLLAGRAGVAVPGLVAAAEANGDALLVLHEPPASLAGATDIDDATLRAIWAAVGRLHGAALVHGRLILDRIGIDADGSPVLSDFAEGRVAATDNERAREVAILLIALAVRVGADRSTDAALAELGADRVAAALPYLQRAVLPREVRPEPGVKETIPAVCAAIADRTGVPVPPPAPLVRVSWRDLAQTTLILVAAYALLSTLIGLDWQTVLDTWQSAEWGWIILGLVIAQATSVVDAISTMSAVTSRLPLWPMVQLQYGIKTLGLAVSASVGRLALNTSILRRYGEGPAVAVTAVALDAAAASLCNVLVVLLGLLLVDRVPSVELSGPDDLSQLVLILVVAVGLSVLVVALVPKLRQKVLGAVRSTRDSMRVVTASPARALLMFGTNLASLLITAIALACMVAGLAPGVSYGECVFVVGAAALFSALVPVPGNVGVGEAALTAGLVAVGVPSGPAFAIAVTQRIATSYLPPIYGGWALRWLRKNDYID